jgi:hypothetical protein
MGRNNKEQQEWLELLIHQLVATVYQMYVVT